MTKNFNLIAERQAKLLNLINTNSSADVHELAAFFGVSAATVRRDLSALQSKGLLVRTHGGAVNVSHAGQDLPNEIRAVANISEKQRIGEECLKLFNGNETVFIDAGTTAVQAASFLARLVECTFVTSSLGVAEVLAAHGHPKFYVTGGCYNPLNQSLGGALAVSALKGLSFDLALLCVGSVDVDRKVVGMSLEHYTSVHQKIISVSRRTFVIADYSKFRSSAFSVSANFSELDGVVTNYELDTFSQNICRDSGLELVLS